jgi:REP element-mobilizing transposase RayT
VIQDGVGYSPSSLKRSLAMPVYLFTFHAYGTWMPDRMRGYVRRGKGILPRDDDMAGIYRAQAKELPASFDETIQRALIDEAIIAGEKQSVRIHYVAAEVTHVHILVSWRSDKPWEKVRAGLRQSCTRRLNREFGRREWLVEGASRKRVKNRSHFDYLVKTYLPNHTGWKWREDKDYFR